MYVTSCFYTADALAAQGNACEVGNDFWLHNLALKAHIFVITSQWSVPRRYMGVLCVWACVYTLIYPPDRSLLGWKFLSINFLLHTEKEKGVKEGRGGELFYQ